MDRMGSREDARARRGRRPEEHGGHRGWDADVAKYFRDSESVNRVLRALINSMPHSVAGAGQAVPPARATTRDCPYRHEDH